MRNLCGTSQNTGQVWLQALVFQTGIPLILSCVVWDAISTVTVLPFLSPTGRLEVSLSLVLFDGRETVSGSTQREKKGCCSLCLWREGGRGTGQCLFLTGQPTCSWFCSNCLEALPHMITKLSLLSNICSSSGTTFEKPGWGTENHRAGECKPTIHLLLFSGGMCWEQHGGGDALVHAWLCSSPAAVRESRARSDETGCDSRPGCPCSLLQAGRCGALLHGSRTSRWISGAAAKGEPVSKHRLSVAHALPGSTRELDLHSSF